MVKEFKYHLLALKSVIKAIESSNWRINGLIASPLIGPAGNHEYLIWISKKQLKEFLVNEEFLHKLVKRTLGSVSYTHLTLPTKG